MTDTTHLVLASTSRYRRELLERLGLPFTVAAPEVDEAEIADEGPAARALRLARAKAAAVAALHPDAVVIGSDQVASYAGSAGALILHKPGSVSRNISQLRELSGRKARFDTAVAVAAPAGMQSHVDLTRVMFRQLDDADLQRYVERESAVDCAGGFKAEGLGVTLLERIESQDPTGLIGLPLIWLCGALRRAGFSLP